ncbi:hypothetical protein [Kribbella sp. NPDC050459]|uniref:hypothetical protein n=1 Tax=Kribbella sp. NPDC050459 TaxID=3155785 RepID=UPI0033ECDFC7
MAWSDCLLNPVSCVVDNVGKSASNAVWDSFVKWSANGLADLSETVFRTFSTSTSPRFDQSWWKDNLDLMVGLSLPMLVAVFILQCVSAVIRREPGRLGQAAIGALLGTVGVPFAIGVIAACGKVVDEVSTGILGGPATTEGLKRMTDITAFLTAPTLGGILLLAVQLGLLAMTSLYFVMLVRDIALIAFVAFVPVAMVSWTWSATRHWLRRWIEVVGALLFSKIAMALVFTLGFSAFGSSGQGAASNLGTFMAGILLVGMAAFAPLATYSFIHWAGDQGTAAVHVMQQGAAGAERGREELERIGQLVMGGLNSSNKDESSPVVGEDEPEDEPSSDGDDGSPADVATDPVGADHESNDSPEQSTGPESAASTAASADPGAAGGASQASGQGD